MWWIWRAKLWYLWNMYISFFSVPYSDVSNLDKINLIAPVFFFFSILKYIFVNLFLCPVVKISNMWVTIKTGKCFVKMCITNWNYSDILRRKRYEEICRILSGSIINHFLQNVFLRTAFCWNKEASFWHNNLHLKHFKWHVPKILSKCFIVNIFK